jgi:hypothetical protein
VKKGVTGNFDHVAEGFDMFVLVDESDVVGGRGMGVVK